MNAGRNVLTNVVKFNGISSLHYRRRFNIHFCLLLILSSLLVSCSVTRKLPLNEKLYTGAKVRIDDKAIKAKQEKELENELESLLRPKPNTSILGIRYKLMFYNMVDSVKNKRGLGNFIKNKLGEPPVLFSDVSTEANEDIICNRLENRGYFHTRCSSDIKEKEKKVSVVYTAIPGLQYMIRNVEFLIDSMNEVGRAIMDASPSTFLKADNPYDLDVIKAERERIDIRLKEKGFYYFAPDDILVLIDSTVGEHKVDLFVRLKQDMPTKAGKIYRIAGTYIFPNYTIADEELNILDAEQHGNFYITDPEHKWKPVTFERYIQFPPGEIYNRTDHNVALNNMASLGAFKFVKNKFVETGDSARLNVFYFLTPYPKKSVRAEISGRKTDADFTGTELNINWRNRSIFRGAELLTIAAYTGTDIQSGIDEILSNRNYFKFGSQVTLSVPRFITPFKIWRIGSFVPRTRFSISYDLLRRQNSYNLNSFRNTFGYTWKENVKKSHDLNVIDINYVHPSSVTDQYRQLAETDETLRKAIEDQFTIGSSYRYVFTNTASTQKINTVYFSSGIEMSGNILGLATDANIRKGKVKRIFGTPFSQYVKLESDMRYYWKISERARLANRLFTGLGYAYGNSNNLPFLKQFYIGGSNSVRAFRARTVGPGIYYAQDDPNATLGFTADQSGDIKIEINSEYRRQLIGVLHGALFVDAGNIWLLRDDLNPNAVKPGATFSKNFLNEFLIGAGAGLRLDLSFVILRFDLAFPLRKPWLPEGERWRFNDIRFGDPVWRKENLVFHVAIGYPF